MINFIRKLRARPIVRMIAPLVQDNYSKWNFEPGKFRYYFVDSSNAIQLSKDFPDIQGICLTCVGNPNTSMFYIDELRFLQGPKLLYSDERLKFTKSERNWLTSLLLQSRQKQRDETVRQRNVEQAALAEKMATSLKQVNKGKQ